MRKTTLILFAVIILLTILVGLAKNSCAYEDTIIVANDNNLYEKKERYENTIYVGESHHLNMYHQLGCNCTNWSICFLENELIGNRIFGIWPEGGAGESACTFLELKDNAPPGDYNITAKLNYTDEEGNYTEKFFHFKICYKKSLEIKNITLPTQTDMRFRITLKLFIDLSVITVYFDGDGILSAHPEEVKLYNLERGIHTIETEIKLDKNGKDWDENEVDYEIITNYKGHRIRFIETNIEVDLGKETEENLDCSTSSPNNSQKYLLAGIIILFLIVFNYTIIGRKGNKKKEGKDERPTNKKSKKERNSRHPLLLGGKQINPKGGKNENSEKKNPK